MSHDQFASPRPSPFNDLSDQRSFYRSPQYGEALARLRYGIEARKGFILFTGDAGTGKSTLLQELARELSENVTCALVSDPHLSFAEIIRSILLQLQVEPESTEEPALLRQCLTLLRSQVESGRIVAVVFDDAHHLREKVVEQVVRNFVDASPAPPHKHLAQIILAGRPELKERLFRPPHRLLGSPPALECQLLPLSEKEVGGYIEHRLRGADLPVDLFGPAAIQPIAACSGGKLRLVNAIGDRAFRSADFSLRRNISPELIEAAAKDLDLWQPRWVRKEEPEMTFTIPKEPDELSGFKFPDDTTEVVGQTFLNFNDDTDRKRWFSRAGRISRAGRNGRALRILSMVVVLGISIVGLQSEPARKYLGEWGVTLGELIGSDRQIAAKAKTEADASPPAATEELVSSAPMPSTNDPQPQDENQKTSDLTAPATEKSAELPSPVQAESPSVKNLPSPPQKAPVRAIRGRQTPPPDDSIQQKIELATQISRAIANRAIPAIEVSVIDGTAYLDGRVATEQQRNAAESAALAVPDVRGVRNRITIE